MRPPFNALLLLSILVSLATNSFGGEADEVTFLGTFVLAGVSIYIQIALTLAAADPEPNRSADHWVKAAFRRRCFWRFTFAGVFALLLVFAGLLAFVIPGLIVGGIVAVAPMAAALERRQPGDAVRRSAELTRPARRPVAIIFGGLVTLPTAVIQAAYYFGPKEGAEVPLAALGVVSVILDVIAVIALTQVFLTLGGTREPLRSRAGPS